MDLAQFGLAGTMVAQKQFAFMGITSMITPHLLVGGLFISKTIPHKPSVVIP
jgi:hypothetical protein